MCRHCQPPFQSTSFIRRMTEEQIKKVDDAEISIHILHTKDDSKNNQSAPNTPAFLVRIYLFLRKNHVIIQKCHNKHVQNPVRTCRGYHNSFRFAPMIPAALFRNLPQPCRHFCVWLISYKILYHNDMIFAIAYPNKLCDLSAAIARKHKNTAAKTAKPYFQIIFYVLSS